MRHGWYALGHVHAARAYGEDARRSLIELAIWTRRLACDLGVYLPARVDVPNLPPGAPTSVRRARAGLELLVGLRGSDFPGPFPYTVRFAAAWCGVGHREASAALQMLRRLGVIVEVERRGRTSLYLPGRSSAVVEESGGVEVEARRPLSSMDGAAHPRGEAAPDLRVDRAHAGGLGDGGGIGLKRAAGAHAADTNGRIAVHEVASLVGNAPNATAGPGARPGCRLEPVTDGDDPTAKIVFAGEVEVTASGLLAHGGDHERSATDEAADFLQAELSSGERTAKEVMGAARDAGISDTALRKAGTRLKIKRRKAGVKRGWMWALPEDDPLPSPGPDGPSRDGGGHPRQAQYLQAITAPQRTRTAPKMTYLRRGHLGRRSAVARLRHRPLRGLLRDLGC